METLYGRNPKRITCQCNDGFVEEMTVEVVTINLNDRCPVCNQTRYICIPKRDIKVKEVPHIRSYGAKVA
jgi:Zn finger protein HypA/HybF involved in hydrogenase expression